MSIKARTVTLTTTPVLLESPQKGIVVYFDVSVSNARIGGSDLTTSTNGFNPNNLNNPGDSIALDRGDDLYGVATTGTAVISYLVIGN